jgi:hypothetical protein
VLYDLVFAPGEDRDVEVVYPGFLSLRELELVEAEQAGHMPAGDQPPFDRLGDLLLGVADPVYQWPAADELVQVLHGRDERRGRRGGYGDRVKCQYAVVTDRARRPIPISTRRVRVVALSLCVLDRLSSLQQSAVAQDIELSIVLV